MNKIKVEPSFDISAALFIQTIASSALSMWILHLLLSNIRVYKDADQVWECKLYPWFHL